MLRLEGGLGSVRTMSACGLKSGFAGQTWLIAALVMSRSAASGGGRLVSGVCAAGVGCTDSSSAGSNPGGTTVRTASNSRVRWAALSVWVPSQCGVNDKVLQLQLPPDP